MGTIGMFQGVYYPGAISGFWYIILVDIAIRAYEDPNGSQNVRGLFQIPNVWYPVALVAFLCLISGGIIPGYISSVLFGYLYVRLHFEKWMPSALTGHKVESKLSCCRSDGCNCIGTRWIAASQTPGWGDDRRFFSAASMSSGGRVRNDRDEGGGGGNPTSNVAVFSGAGRVLGEGPPTPPPPTVDVESQDDPVQSHEVGHQPQAEQALRTDPFAE